MNREMFITLCVDSPPPQSSQDLDGDLLANTPISGIGDWVPGPSGSGGYVLNSNGTPVNGATTFI